MLLVLGLAPSIAQSGGGKPSLVFPFLPVDVQTNISVAADLDHPKICPAELTNVLSNTNLFSEQERLRLLAVIKKYQNVTTNAGPAGTEFIGLAKRERDWKNTKQPLIVACFKEPESKATCEIATLFGKDHYIQIQFRELNGDGYNASFIDGKLMQFQEYKAGQLEGLYLAMKGFAPPKHETCATLARFRNGKLVGRFLGWANNGDITCDAEFAEPFDFLKFQVIKTDLAWRSSAY